MDAIQKSETKLERSCGAVVFTRKAGLIQFVIIRSLAGRYGFPKGHMEPGETEEQTALREIREEVGLRPRLIPGFRTEDEFLLPQKPGTRKRVVYFLAEYEGQPLRPLRTELRSATLMPYALAMEALEFESIRRILTQANEFLSRSIP